MTDQRTESRARVRVAVFVVLGIHLVVLATLLIQGCKREEPAPPVEQPQITQPVFEPTNVPMAETSAPPVAPVAIQPQPTPAVEATREPTPQPTEYTVQPGDTFYSIGKKFGVSYLAIEAANPDVDPRRLKPGQKILIPAPTTPAAAAEAGAVLAPEAAGGETIYVVKSGDTLTKIARQFGVTVNAIRRANNLTTDRIKVGDKLKIPAKPVEPLGSQPSPVPQGDTPVRDQPQEVGQPWQAPPQAQ